MPIKLTPELKKEYQDLFVDSKIRSEKQPAVNVIRDKITIGNAMSRLNKQPKFLGMLSQ